MSARYTLEELLAVDLSHTIHDGEVGFTGLATGKAATAYITCIPMAAMELARCTHAPNLTILLSGVYFNPDVSKLYTLPESEYEQVLVDLPSESQMPGWPEQWHHRAGDISFGFGSGVQVDREGNLNSTCIGDVHHPKVELVGPIFLPEHFSCFGREYIMMPTHEKRNFVEHVDYISGVGWPGGAEGRRKLGFIGGGPKYIYTPKCIFAFDEEGVIYLKSIHPGVSKQDVIDSTGFAIPNINEDIPITPEPTDEELHILRTQADPNGVFLGSGISAAGD